MQIGISPVLVPSIYPFQQTIEKIMAVLETNCISTNSINNALSLIRLGDNNTPEIVEIVKDYFPDVGSGDQLYSLGYSRNEVAYTQGRGIVVVDFESKNARMHNGTQSDLGEIRGFALFHRDTRQLLLDITEPGFPEETRIIKIVSLENNSIETVAEAQIGTHSSGYSGPWCIWNQHLFIYNQASASLQLFDSSLKQTDHPVCTIFNRSQENFGKLRSIIVHPQYPVAFILTDNLSLNPQQWGKQLRIIRWQEDDEEKQVTLLQTIRYLQRQSLSDPELTAMELSPDNQWIVIKDETAEPAYYAVRLNPEDPIFLDKSVKLGGTREDAELLSTCWIEQPLSFVATDGTLVYKWMLQ